MVERAHRLEQVYDVEVVAFSWPANGGGLEGVASYKSDKRDALASIGALDRCIQRIGDFLRIANTDNHKAIRKRAEKKFGDDAERREAFIADAMEKSCPVRISMMLHSMGNYLFKHLLLSNTYHARELVFDNVILAAADTNNVDHARWVDKIQCRSRVYITINEDDSALRASRMKLGSQQLARLGHLTYNLDSTHGTYVDFTQAKHVGTSHAYFEGEPTENEEVRAFFEAAVHGCRAEDRLQFDASRNLFRTKG